MKAVPTQAILPIKSFDAAKRRLQDHYAASQRRQLAEAMFCDVLVALEKTEALTGTLVVSADPRAQEIARRHGARVHGDDDRGHNRASLAGIRDALARGADRALLVPGDCPLLSQTELDRLLARPAGDRSVIIVPDRHGTGTNALLLSPPDVLAPAFGPGSCHRHAASARAAKVTAEVVQVPTLALDVDTSADLQQLRAELANRHDGAAVTRERLELMFNRAGQK